MLLLSLLVTPIDFSANSASRKLMAGGKTLQIRQGQQRYIDTVHSRGPCSPLSTPQAASVGPIWLGTLGTLGSLLTFS